MQRQFRPKPLNRREPHVEDLREKLNRKKQEKLNDENGVSKNLPPPDPSYNFLKDPMRGDDFGQSSPKKSFPKKQTEENVVQKKGENPQSEPNIDKLERNSGHRDDKRNQNWKDKKYFNKKKFPPSPKDEQPKHEILNQLPLNNIKVEVSGETGKRKCIVDESKIIELPKIDESKFSKQQPRETQKYYFNRQTQESRSLREKKSDNKEELNQDEKGITGIGKPRSNYRKNFKQKKDYKKEGEESVVSSIEHASEEKATTEEKPPSENK